MGERADRVQLHDSAGHAGEEAQLDDAAGGLDLDVVANPGREVLRICHAPSLTLDARGKLPFLDTSGTTHDADRLSAKCGECPMTALIVSLVMSLSALGPAGWWSVL
jgi:hypothetical protein